MPEARALLWLGLFVWVQGASAFADDTRARADYMIHCQGCHVQDGSGFEARGVPDMRVTIGQLLAVEGGRGFLVQVPGSSQADLSDARLAGTLNWIVSEIGGIRVPEAFAPYTADEVTALRTTRLDDVFATRAALIGHLEETDGRTTK